MSKNTLTIKKYWNSGGDLETEVASFMVQDRVKDSVRIVRLIVSRKLDNAKTAGSCNQLVTLTEFLVGLTASSWLLGSRKLGPFHGRSLRNDNPRENEEGQSEQALSDAPIPVPPVPAMTFSWARQFIFPGRDVSLGLVRVIKEPLTIPRVSIMHRILPKEDYANHDQEIHGAKHPRKPVRIHRSINCEKRCKGTNRSPQTESEFPLDRTPILKTALREFRKLDPVFRFHCHSFSFQRRLLRTMKYFATEHRIFADKIGFHFAFRDRPDFSAGGRPRRGRETRLGTAKNARQSTPRASASAMTAGHVGSCVPVSSLLMVRTVLPICLASCSCVNPAARRSSFILAANCVSVMRASSIAASSASETL